MAGSSNNNQFGSQLYLSPNQQDLLLAALNSNNPNAQNLFKNAQGDPDYKQGGSGTFDAAQSQQSFSMESMNPAFFGSPTQDGSAVNFGGFDMDGSPFVDFLDGDTSFDYDGTENDDLMIGSIPGTVGPSDDSPTEGKSPESNDKRKSPDDGIEDGNGGGKRREGDDKTAKKPGRKPLTSEPTTKRKAQNRAAQRAFRERKEKHLKDLEAKVAELTKASDAANHENGLLRAQVQRLQTELREYRKRLSLNASAGTRSSTLPASGFSYLSGLNNSAGNSFQFEFPRFGGLPGTHMLNNNSLGTSNSTPNTGSAAAKSGSNAAAGVLARQGNSVSPTSQDGSLSGADAKVDGMQKNSRSASQSSPTAPQANQSNADTSYGQNTAFQSNSTSTSSNSDSPSASSVSQYGGPSSSCGTSPEPSQNSPSNNDAPKDTIENGYICHGNSEGEITFCEKLNMACGNPRNPVPRAMSMSNGKLATPAAGPSSSKTPAADVNGIDFFANQNGGQFDPVLFGDYRESQNAVMGDGDFSGGFFDDAFGLANYGSPNSFHFGDTPAISTANKPNPMDDVVRAQDGDDDEVVPGEDTSQMLNCHKIWDKLANHPDFKDGTIDIDSLCSELRAKARCSESGVVVDNKDVEAALKRLPEQQRPTA